MKLNDFFLFLFQWKLVGKELGRYCKKGAFCVRLRIPHHLASSRSKVNFKPTKDISLCSVDHGLSFLQYDYSNL